MKKVIAILATMDTKGAESNFVREELKQLGADSLLIDIGVIGEPGTKVDVKKEDVFESGGKSFSDILKNPTRQEASEIMIKGAGKILLEKIRNKEIHAVVSLGGTQGTANCARILQQLPYGFPKVILSTVASGDTSGFMDIKDITMMPAVADILGLNPFSRKILANLAGTAYGMSLIERDIKPEGKVKGVIGMTNLGVLTNGAMHAIEQFNKRGYEVITFHAVGTGGRAMEQMMKEGLFSGIFDYALGEIADGVYGGLRAANDERLTVAGKLGLPQVICPGGAEHLGYWVDKPNSIPEGYKDHQHVFHTPYIYVPRLNAEEIKKVAECAIERLADVKDKCIFLIPEKGVSRYSVDGGELIDRESDKAFFDSFRNGLPKTIQIESLPYGAEDPEFVDQAVEALVGLMETSEIKIKETIST